MSFALRNDVQLRSLVSKARALIDAGWVKGQMRNGNRFCALGALAEAAGGNYKLNDILNSNKKFRKALGKALGTKLTTSSVGVRSKLITFNDSTYTKKSDVTKLFTKVKNLIS